MKPSRAVLFIATLLVAVAVHPSPLRLGRDVVPTAQEVRLRVDPRQDSFRGSVRIEMDVLKPTSMFRFHAADMQITSLQLEGGLNANYVPDIDQTVRVTTERPLQKGKQTVMIDYTAPFNRAAVGLYKVLKDGQPYLFTQFQAIDARRAFPCWDEPSFKLPYQLTVEIPTQYAAVSNTPIADESESDPWKTVRFAATKPLPSYLIALAVGQFDYAPIRGMSVPGRIVAPKGQGALTGLAAEVTPPVMAALEKYFGSPFPFEKNDMLAVPEFWAGAMENPGAITFRDTILLLDRTRATPSQRRSLIRIVAHELAHMWFGDLVTMEWWEDFWLNESFADWMGDKITEQLNPELGLRLAELQGLQQVMNNDGRTSTVPLRNRGADPAEAMNNVGIAYDKGKAVLSMFEQWIGKEKFRRGVLDHLEGNAWANADAGEFFAALARHAPKGTAEALATFVDQPGIPLVRADWKGGQLRLTQSRYSLAGASVKPLTWKVPVKIRYSDGKQIRTAAVLLDTPSRTITLEGSAIEWLFPNDGAAGYYRWQTPPVATQTLAERAVEVLSPDERLVFLGNAGALLRAGLLPGDEYLAALSRFGSDPNPQVVQSATAAVGQLKLAFAEGENRAPFAAYVRRTFGASLERISLNRSPEESETVTILRPVLIALMAEEGGDPKLIAWAKGEAAKYLQDPTSVDSAIATTALGIAARDGDEALFNDLVQRFEAAKLPAERQRFLSALGKFRNPAVRDRALGYVLKGPLRPTEIFVIPGAGKESTEERDRYYRWVTSNYDELTKRLPPAF
ncbi:MAG: M1 family metallopeptidase, partial [Thermoanaerobaculia bacterium]